MRKNCLKIKHVAIFVALLFMGVLTSCSSDDKNEVEEKVTESELIGTWYNTEYRVIMVFTSDVMTIYGIDIDVINGKYKLGDSESSKYKIKNNIIYLTDDNEKAKYAKTNGYLVIQTDGDPVSFSKFKGTPQQVIYYINSSEDEGK